MPTGPLAGAEAPGDRAPPLTPGERGDRLLPWWAGGSGGRLLPVPPPPGAGGSAPAAGAPPPACSEAPLPAAWAAMAAAAWSGTEVAGEPTLCRGLVVEGDPACCAPCAVCAAGCGCRLRHGSAAVSTLDRETGTSAS